MYRVPKYFPSKRLALPRKLNLDGSKNSVIDYMKVDDTVEETFNLLEICAKSSFNVGLDEFTMDAHEFDIEHGENFIIRDEESKELQGLIMLRPSAEGRSVIPSSVRIIILLIPPLQSRENFAALVDLSTEMSKDVELGYNFCSMRVFTMCDYMIDELCKRGFHITATFPYSGNVPGKGLTESHLMVKTLSLTDYGYKPWDVVEKFVIENLEAGDEFDIPRMSILPIDYTLRSGLVVTIRNLTDEEEGRQVYNLLRESAKKAKGYGLDENPTFQYFVENTLNRSYTMILEDKFSGETLALFTMVTSHVSRTQEPHTCDTNILVKPSVRGAGVGLEMSEIFTGLCKDLNYKIAMSECFYFNEPMARVARKLGYHVMGCIPKTSYVEGRGWTDGLLFFRDLRDVMSFTEMKAAQMKEQQAVQLTPSNM